MEIFNTLAEFGLTTKVIQFIIVAAIAVVVVGFYWRIIVTGAILVFCVVAFAMPSTGSIDTRVDANVAPAEFIEDCLKYNDGATKTSCQKIWKEDGNGKE